MSGRAYAMALSVHLSIGWAVALATVLSAAWMAAFTARILRRLPEPVINPGPQNDDVPGAPGADAAARAADDPAASFVEPLPGGRPAGPTAEVKIAYRDLPTRRFLIGCVTVAACCAALSAVAVSSAQLPLWLVLATIGVLLAAIDLVTTWLPKRLCHAAWLAMGVAVCVCLLLGAGLEAGARAVLGAVVAGALYGFIWLVSRGGIGFGDVRFAPLIGAPAAAESWTLLIWALLAGSLLGAVHGVIRLASHRERSFPYAPAMLVGAYLALLASWLT